MTQSRGVRAPKRKGDTEPRGKRDYWLDGIFVTGGQGYGVTIDGRTIHVGTEEEILAELEAAKEAARVQQAEEKRV